MPVQQRQVQVRAEQVRLPGDLAVPPGPKGVVAFAHGSGSSRFSPRNRFVAGALQDAGLATLLLDLLTPKEEAADARTGRLRFDVSLLARRLVAAVDALSAEPDVAGLPVGCFGASTGAAAALVAAAERPRTVGAVVSRGGRPDLAAHRLAEIAAPTLLVVGGADREVIELNRRAMAMMAPGVEVHLEVVPGASHLFEEPGALERVAELAAAWFVRHLAGGPRRPAAGRPG